MLRKYYIQIITLIAIFLTYNCYNRVRVLFQVFSPLSSLAENQLWLLSNTWKRTLTRL